MSSASSESSRHSPVLKLTEGSPLRLLLLFSYPIIAGMLFQQFYNVVDTAIVGRFLGVQALAGMGATTSLYYLVSGFCTGCCSGFSIPVSHSFGKDDSKEVHRLFVNAGLLTFMLSAVITFLTVLFCRQILLIMHTPEDILDYSYQYLLFIFMGIPITCFYNLLAAMLRALGDSKTPVVSMLIASVFNLLADLLFMGVFHMGIASAAAATLLAQALSGMICLVHILRKTPELHPAPGECAPSLSRLRHLLVMGVPMGLESSIMSVGLLILQTAVNDLGKDAVAANTAGGKITFLFAIFFEGLGSAMATYAGQNAGAGKSKRIDEGFWTAVRIGLLYSLLSFLLIFFFGRFFAGLFLGRDGAYLLETVYTFMVTVSAFFIPVLFLNLFRYMIQGMGHPLPALLAGFAEVAARIIIAWFLIPRIGFTGVRFANPLSWTMAAMILLPVYIRIRRRLQKS